jgi:hypothetical protein
MPTTKVRWQTLKDGHPICPICEHIDNYEFVFDGFTMPDSLFHPVYGEVWNKVTGSLAHEHYQFGKKSGIMASCKCSVVPVSVSAPELLEALKKLRDELREALQEGENPDYQSGSSRKTTFEDLGIDPSKYDFE